MALATRCPHCQTAFRVASDQLKLRAGLVRCGTCKEIFNGIENLLHPDEDIVAATAAPTPPIPTVEDAVVANRRVRGDETRYADLIAEVDGVPPPAPPGAAVVEQADRQASEQINERADEQADEQADAGPSLETNSALLWQAIDAAPPYDAFGVEPTAGASATARADVPDDVQDDAQDDAKVDADPAVEGTADIDAGVDDHGDADAAGPHRHDPAIAGDADAHADANADADADADADEDADAPAAIAAPATPKSAADAGDPLLPTLPSLLRAAAAPDAEADPAAPRAEPQPVARGKTRKPLRSQPAAAFTADTNADAAAPGALADHLPDFIAREEAREDRHRARRPLLIGAAVLLTLTLLAQAVYAGRTTLSASFPLLRPVLEQGCRLIGCMVGLPTQIESVSIESSDFQPVPGSTDQFLLTVLLRNRSSTVQAWPTIELTLNDATDKAVGRRLIPPRDYLPAGQTAIRGFSAGSEQTVRLVFDLSRLKASGYRVYVFYP